MQVERKLNNMDSREILVYEENCTRTLKIHNFENEQIHRPGQCRLSFKSKIAMEHFNLYMSANGFNTGNEGFITVFLRKSGIRNAGRHKTLITSCCFIVYTLDVHGNTKFPRTFQTEFRDENFEYLEVKFEEKYIRRSSILNNADEFLLNNIATFCIDISISEWTHPICGLILNDPYMLSHVAGVYDATVTHENAQFLTVQYVRRNLYHESSYFRRLCDTPLRESKKLLMTIPDGEYNAFISMLRFIETGVLSFEEVTVYELYVLADKYDVPRLLKECRQVIIRSLSKENVSDVLNFISRFNDPELKGIAEMFLVNPEKASEICNTFSEENSNLDNSSEILGREDRDSFDFYF